MTAREIALTYLRRWTISAARLPPGAVLLEGTLSFGLRRWRRPHLHLSSP